MIGLGMLANSGTMSLAGGKASSTNGDQTNGGLKTGGINMGGGSAFPFHLVLLAILAVVVVIKLKG
ncbi:hypothetical protein [Agarivorans sp. DSG3-1]|uniref:hypothetical protein n=1 Tax=Agarivorans sp. DSG3-1 TaxID=3342249 RepID=UPI00398E5954